MSSLLYWILHLAPIGLILYFYIRRKFSYWANLGIPGPKPSLLKFGNVLQIYGADPSQVEQDLVRNYGKVYGYYTLLEPTLIVADPELIKQMLVKDFPSFMNRRKLNAYHELLNGNEFFADGEQWKRLRTISSPTFTTGKLRSMHLLMNQCIGKLLNYLKDVADKQEGVIQTKEVVVGFTIDTIASTSFATETNANSTQHNQFVSNGLGFFDENPLKAFCYLGMPRWFNDLIGLQHIFGKSQVKFFADLSKAILEQRKSGQGIKRNDFFQLLMDSSVNDSELKDSNFDKLAADNEFDDSKKDSTESRNSTKTKLTDNEIIAQSILFFVAGFETTSSTISNLFFELAINPEIQDRLLNELHALEGQDNGSEEYFNAVMQLPYLEAVIKESLRKYPPGLKLERRLTVDEYKLGGILLKKDQLVEVPIYAMHHNPEYYPEPDLFDPNRFMPENKHNLVPYTYLPFGAGPRNCIGMRFAYQEVKLCIAQIIPRFRLAPTANTPAKLKFGAFRPALNVEPFEIRVEKRLSNNS